jgi:pyruvate/oxaloacetate carboxyltransferase
LVVRCDIGSPPLVTPVSLIVSSIGWRMRLANRYRTTDKTKLQLLQAFAHESR